MLSLELMAIPHFKNFKINSAGQVFSTKRKNLFLLNPHISNVGYWCVHLEVNGRQAVTAVHRLLAAAFIPNPNNLPLVNHLDGDKLNNALSNLEWASYSRNIQHAYDTGLRKSRKGGATHRSKMVYQFCLSGKLICAFPTVRAASRSMDTSDSAMRQAVSSNAAMLRGFRWSHNPVIDGNIPIRRVAKSFYIFHLGQTKSLCAWCRELGISKATVYFRYKKNPNATSEFLLRPAI